MGDWEKVLSKNQNNLARLNLPKCKGQQKIFIFDEWCPYSLDVINITPVFDPGKNDFGIHGTEASQVIKLVYPNAIFYGCKFRSDWMSVVDFCISNGIRIINASINSTYGEAKEEALKKYVAWGGIFVTTAGNNSGSIVAYPGRSNYVICVSSSNYPDNDGPEIDITADSYWPVRNKEPGMFDSFNGTSCAAPVIAGCVAHILDKFPSWKLPEIISFLQKYSTPLDEQYERYFTFPDEFEVMKEMNHYEFIELIKPGAIKAYREYNILPSLTMAQAILESGWGSSAPGNMLFGIKWTEACGYDWQELMTSEYINGKWIRIKAKFRKYNSLSDSVEDHGKLLLLSRYAPVRQCTNYKDACYQIRACGYATDPQYTQLLINIIEENNLQKYDQEGFKMFNDYDKIDSYAQAYVLKAKELGIMNGDGDGNFKPKDFIMREDLAIALVNLYNKIKGA